MMHSFMILLGNEILGVYCNYACTLFGISCILVKSNMNSFDNNEYKEKSLMIFKMKIHLSCT